MISQASLPAGSDNHSSSIHDSVSCLDCHSYIKEIPDHPLVEDSNVSCMGCHDISSAFTPGRRNKVKCLNCHSRHHEKIANDAHINVPCKACHLAGIKPVKEMENNLPVWLYEPMATGGYDPHRFISEKEKICSRCHYYGNNLSVSDNVLPAKSIICMPCHASTFSVGDIPSAAAIIIFLIGILSIVFMWFSAGKSYRKNEGFKITRFISIADALIFDILFQRRLLQISKKRWFIHEMIFLPFLFRFLWGIIALVFSLFKPEWNITWVMLDKNNPVTGLIFDITGIIILMGGVLMVFEKKRDKNIRSFKNLPKSNVLVNLLLGGMIITGFIVEGARIAMTGCPAGSEFSFVGFWISRFFSGYHLNGLFAYLWYLHAVITAAFIACLPFSRMFHIFTAPLSLLLRGEAKG